jgi:hypothetical protein
LLLAVVVEVLITAVAVVLAVIVLQLLVKTLAVVQVLKANFH